MALNSTISSAWDLLLFGNGTDRERITLSLQRLLDISPVEIKKQQQVLLEKLPLNAIRTFGPAEIVQYVKNLDKNGVRNIVDTIAKMHLLNRSTVRVN
jgi:hypothetical protein